MRAWSIALLIAGAACGRGGETARRPSDSAFAAMQTRGQAVMGVDQYASAHVFEDLADGGRIIFLAFQRSAHHAGGHEGMRSRP